MDNKGGSKSSSSSEEQPPLAFGVFCSDCKTVSMDMKCVYESGRMYRYLKGIDERIADEEEEGMDLRHCHTDPRDISFTGKVTSPSYVALLANTYCVGRFNIMKNHRYDGVDLLARKLKEFDAQFTQDLRDIPILPVLLFNVAVQMSIESLINLMLNTMHEGGSAFAEAIFNMPAIKDSEIPFFNRYVLCFDAIDMCDRDSF